VATGQKWTRHKYTLASEVWPCKSVISFFLTRKKLVDGLLEILDQGYNVREAFLAVK
jgi:hypothetical protein